MFLKHLKSTFAKNQSVHCLRRSIVSSSSCGQSTTTSPENEKHESSRNKKDIETYRPLSEDEIQKIVNLDNIHIVTKFQTKLPQRPPLIQNFFIGKIDVQHLTYPEVMEVKDFNEMTEKISAISNYFTKNACTPAYLQFRDVSHQMINDFRNMKLFGASVHQRFGGLGYFKSEMHRASESEANDVKSFLFLAGHRLAVEAIFDHGNVSHHNQWLMDMGKGEIIGAACLHEPLSKADSNMVKVAKTHDGDYVLNGSKSFASISQHANLLIVVAEKSDELKQEFALDDDDDDDDDFFDAYLTIVLDPKSSGITFSDEYKTIGCNDVPFVTVNFENVRIEKDQILSENTDDRKISQKLLASSRLQMATLNMVQAKNMFNKIVTFTIRSACNSEKLRNLMYVRESLAKIACDLYGLESMIYLSAGILDMYDNPKVDLECAITKAYSQDILRNLNQFAMNLIDTPVTIEDHSIDVDIRNTLQLQYNETSSALKSYVGRVGLQHTLDHFGKHVKSYKDSIWAKLNLANSTIEDLEPQHFLGDFLHPSLIETANDLEYSILRMQYSSEMLLNSYGEKIADREIEIRNLGEAAMQNYAMFASVARASRAYCIGLRYSAYETMVAGCLIQAFSPSIRKMALDIKHNRGPFPQNIDETIAENLLKQHRNKSSTIPSVLNGVLQKSDKN
ncbi:complex I assembly factor ACAD9, mitochondrial-like [Contarinia nasturtii]|uniref:complex I assembly factor ACAD9, mitochondrial-like n=1 Tax=Contarinia nasturtii TaxID=265458 RepID=UPI0012D43C9F|nr:complex I assembly factor ACAD9, mitochondrial-like [Contarinia nasturtii]